MGNFNFKYTPPEGQGAEARGWGGFRVFAYEHGYDVGYRDGLAGTPSDGRRGDPGLIARGTPQAAEEGYYMGWLDATRGPA